MLALLVAHGRDAHLRSHAEMAAPEGVAAEEVAAEEVAAEPATEAALALVDFNVVAGQESLARQVIVIRGDRIVEVGPVGAAPIPRDARRVEGRGQRLIVMGEPGSTGSVALPVAGAPADLIVVGADPRGDPALLGRPLAVVSDGAWEASRPPVSSAGVLGLPRR